MTLALLQSAHGEVQSHAADSRAVHRRARLAWEALSELYGNEAILRDRIEKLKAAHIVGSDELLQLADRYLTGWRPNNFNEDETRSGRARSPL
jgi:hypothetical protein